MTVLVRYDAIFLRYRRVFAQPRESVLGDLELKGSGDCARSPCAQTAGRQANI